ncbi:hypothetical protein BY996DRAFT_6544120 [Phakopsora pachyrhizi]|nr:hypothetical protein BY996DRAFT_6544120 [Phakopsora pachyrhizi]
MTISGADIWTIMKRMTDEMIKEDIEQENLQGSWLRLGYDKKEKDAYPGRIVHIGKAVIKGYFENQDKLKGCPNLGPSTGSNLLLDRGGDLAESELNSRRRWIAINRADEVELKLAQSEDWSATVNAPRGQISFGAYGCQGQDKP